MPSSSSSPSPRRSSSGRPTAKRVADDRGSDSRPSLRRSLDPQGKRALFEAPVEAPPDILRAGPEREGREALYSTGPRRAGTVLIDCSGCRARARTHLADVGLRLLTLSAWVPGRRHSHWMRCPSCGHRTWCRIGWTD